MKNLFRTLSSFVGVALLLAACGSASDVTTDAVVRTASEPQPSTTVASTPSDSEPEPEPSTTVAAVQPPATVQTPDGLVLCEDVPRLGGDAVGTLGAVSNPDDRVMGVLYNYAQEHLDTYAGRWIDRERGGVIVMVFTDDPEPHHAALLDRGPLETDEVGVEPPPPITDARTLGERDDFVFEVIRATHTEQQLLDAQMTLHSRVGFESGLQASGVDVIGNTVSAELIDPSAEGLELIANAVTDLPVCVNIFIPPKPPEGPLDIIAAPGEPFTLPPGLGEVGWELDPAYPAPGPTDVEIQVLATEFACASGREMGDALRGPQVVEIESEVIIAFAVEESFGGRCPSNPPTAVTVTLSEPLGDRTLVNGGASR